jgi:transposase
MAPPPPDAFKARRKAEILGWARRAGNVALTCRRFGISRTIFYRWRRRFEREGPAGLADGSRRPRRMPRRTPVRDAAKIFYLRLALGWSPGRIQGWLERVHGLRMSASGIWKILDGSGLGRRSRRPELLADGRTLYVWPAVDRQDRGKKSRTVLFAAIDAEAGAAVVGRASSGDPNRAAAFIDAALAHFPLRVETIVTPSRPEFEGYFHWHVLGLGLEHRTGEHPLLRSEEALWDPDFIARAAATRLAEGMIVCRDRRINRAVEAWDRPRLSVHRKGK